jgi:hypothetical protein
VPTWHTSSSGVVRAFVVTQPCSLACPSLAATAACAAAGSLPLLCVCAHQVPIEKVFNKSLLNKFHWCMDTDSTFRF